SRSLRNLENQARRRRMREQPALCVGDARLRGGGAAADAERLALGAHRAGILRHALDEGDLEFERGVAGTGAKAGLNRKSRGGIKQDRSIATMDRADRVVI